MPRHRLIPTAWLWLALWTLKVAVAEQPGFDVAHWNTETGLPPNALPQNSVIAMAQTREGYLWVGTLSGLARFDGRQFTVFDESNLPQLASGRIVYLFADEHGGLWVGTETAGSVLIKNGVVTPLEIGGRGRAGRLVAACEQTNGVVWLCTANGRLSRAVEGQLSEWQLPTNAPPPLDIGEYHSLAIEDNTLWIGAQGLLLALDTKRIVPGKPLPAETQMSWMSLQRIVRSTRGGFWLLGNNQVLKLRALNPERNFGAYPWPETTPILSACEDREGNLVVGTQDRGLTWFDADGRYETLTSAGALRDNNTVLSLLADREGSLWVGTDGGGLKRIKRQVFAVQPESLGKAIQSVSAGAAGGVWFAVDNEPLRFWKDGKLQEFGTSDGLPSLHVRSVLVDRSQTVWVGLLEGLFRLETNRFQPAPYPGNLLPAASVLHQDRRGTLWVGTPVGLARWDGTNWSRLTTAEGLSANDVQALADDAQGNLWIGTAGGGLNQFREGRITPFRKAVGLPSDSVSALLAEAEGVLWVGTSGGGLARYDGHRWTHFSTGEGLAGNSIRFLLADDAGNLWIGSNAGLMRVAKAELDAFAPGEPASVNCRTFGSPEGLPTRECSPFGKPAACRSADGALWFATIKGLASVNPARLVRNTNPPPVMIEAVLVDDVMQNTNRLRLNWPTQVVIPAGHERLEIRYTSLNLLAPERARFRYQLEGNERTWTEAGDTRVAHYNNLSPGDYTFHVKAANEDGVWNEIGATLNVIVEPPFWRTWWFLTVATVALLGMIVGTVHFISTQKLQRQLAAMRQQGALERERARIARDLHDQLGANLTQVSLLGELVESDKDLPEEVEAHAKQITETARTTALALDEIVWAANPANDTLEGLVNYACKYAQEYVGLAGLSYRLEAPEKLPALLIPPEVRHNVFLAFKESVNNVVKHARASAVKVRVRLEANRFVFEVEDDGRGVAAEDQAKGRNGLRNMRKRMEDVGGEFWLGPGAERGTLVRLTAPVRPLAV